MVVGPGTTRSIYQLACSKADVDGAWSVDLWGDED